MKNATFSQFITIWSGGIPLPESATANHKSRGNEFFEPEASRWILNPNSFGKGFSHPAKIKESFYIISVHVQAQNWKCIKNEIIFSGLFTEHSIVGLETRWWCHLFGRIKIRFYRSKLPGSRLFDYDGEFICHEVFQNGKYPSHIFG